MPCRHLDLDVASIPRCANGEAIAKYQTKFTAALIGFVGELPDFGIAGTGYELLYPGDHAARGVL
jgi:hypothetical protein